VKITNNQLKQIIKEELEAVLSEEDLKQQRQRFKDEDEALNILIKKYGKSLYGASKEELMTIGFSEEDVDGIVTGHEKMKTAKEIAQIAKQKAQKTQDEVEAYDSKFHSRNPNNNNFQLIYKIGTTLTSKILELNHKKLLAIVNKDQQKEAKIQQMLNNFAEIANDVHSLTKQNKYDEIRKKYFNFIKETKDETQ